MSANSHLTTAVHIVALIAYSDRRLSSSWIAGSVATNPVVIRQIIGKLRDAGLVETMPGATGGAALARPADQITLAQVYSALGEGSLFGLHAHQPNQRCPVGRNIQSLLADVFGEMDATVLAELGKTTIADMAHRVGNLVNQEGDTP